MQHDDITGSDGDVWDVAGDVAWDTLDFGLNSMIKHHRVCPMARALQCDAPNAVASLPATSSHRGHCTQHPGFGGGGFPTGLLACSGKLLQKTGVPLPPLGRFFNIRI